jgi:hypothetical protein
LAHFGLNLDWTDFNGYFSRLERQGIWHQHRVLCRRDCGSQGRHRQRRPTADAGRTFSNAEPRP